jgi:hypothetical protein
VNGKGTGRPFSASPFLQRIKCRIPQKVTAAASGVDFTSGKPLPTGSDLSSFVDFFMEDAGQEKKPIFSPRAHLELKIRQDKSPAEILRRTECEPYRYIWIGNDISSAD